ncbi:hypothetical protein JXB02_06005 [Candidatus Woesearchaeota archaeon]|nr:hypothetical protein [Candidatus Woesearchaeota archaeon]
MCTITNRIKSHVLEKVIGTLMVIFGVAAIYIFVQSLKLDILAQDIAMIEILLIIVLAILAQTVVLIRIYENQLDGTKK